MIFKTNEFSILRLNDCRFLRQISRAAFRRTLPTCPCNKATSKLDAFGTAIAKAL